MASTTLLDAESKTKSTHQLYSTYLGISFAVFLSFLPQSALSFLPTLQSRNQFIHHRLRRAEEELTQLRSRRQEDSKANARVVEIFATHRNAWQQEERRLLRRLDELSEEIARLRARVSDLEAHECQLINEIDELRREVGERDEMINFMSRHHSVDGDGGGGGGGSGGGDVWGCGGEDVAGVKLMSGGEFDGFDGSYLSSSPSKLWQNVQYETLDPMHHVKHFVVR